MSGNGDRATAAGATAPVAGATGRGAAGSNGGPPTASAGYYGDPVVNPPVWRELDIAGYLFTGGLSGATALLAAGADLTGRPVLARRAKLCASGAIALSLGALVKDLGRPLRFLNMLRVFKPTSPMSVGVWLLVGYAPLTMAAAASNVTGVLPRLGRAAGLGAAALAPGVASYTAALIADTAVPAWHEAHRELPFVFVSSAAAAGGGFALIAAPLHETRPARHLALMGAAGELVAERLLHRRLGMVAEAYERGSAGRRLKTAQALEAAGAVGVVALAGRSRVGAALSGAALVAGSVLTRFGIFAAGMASARDPKHTIEPQRERAAARARQAL